jgi:hypothetical protein
MVLSQESYFWSGTEVGDAVLAPYGAEHFNLFHELLVAHNVWKEGIIPSYHGSFQGHLEVTNPAGTTVRVAPGTAIVKGSLYFNDANVDFSASTIGYYTVLVSLVNANKETRLAMLGPNISFPPNPTQIEDQVWQIELATLYSTGAAISSITDKRRFIRDVFLHERQGGTGSDWQTPGTNNYKLENLKYQMGSSDASSTTVNITFPRAFAYIPLVYISLYSGATPATAQYYISAVSTTGFTVTFDSVSNLGSFQWFAVGDY